LRACHFWYLEGNTMSEKFTAGPWVWSSFSQSNGKPITTVKHVAQTVAGSAKHSDRAELFGVTLDDAAGSPDGRATVVCYTGNGPNAHNNARAMAQIPQLTDFLRHLLDERDHGFVYSADRVTAQKFLDYLEGCDRP
jgi:hypothetical protein